MMTADFSLTDLKTGDIIRSRFSGDVYVVMENYGNYTVAVRTVNVSNPCEWCLVVRNRSDSNDKNDSEVDR